jgi:hypothetical protein
MKKMNSRVLLVTASCLVTCVCARSEDPARTALKIRLKQPAQIPNDQLPAVLEQVRSATARKTVRIREGAGTHDLDPDQRSIVLGMLSSPAGMFDEGLRQENGATFRVLNAPGEPLNAEIEATRRLWIDVETLLPRRFEFAYAIPGFGDYSLDLTVEP